MAPFRRGRHWACCPCPSIGVAVSFSLLWSVLELQLTKGSGRMQCATVSSNAFHLKTLPGKFAQEGLVFLSYLGSSLRFVAPFIYHSKYGSFVMFPVSKGTFTFWAALAGPHCRACTVWETRPSLAKASMQVSDHTADGCKHGLCLLFSYPHTRMRSAGSSAFGSQNHGADLHPVFQEESHRCAPQQCAPRSWSVAFGSILAPHM